jgi:ribosome maturation factor RimP
MSAIDRVRALVDPIVAASGLDLYDLELNGAVLRVVVDQPGGVGMDAIAAVTRAISRGLDEADPIEGRFTLEVSSPGLERTLRTPDHFASALGTAVSIKAVAGLDGDRRFTGMLETVDDDGIVVATSGSDATRRLSFDQIERARTVFEWGPTPKPGGSKNVRTKRSRSTKAGPAKSDRQKSSQQKKVIAS